MIVKSNLPKGSNKYYAEIGIVIYNNIKPAIRFKFDYLYII